MNAVMPQSAGADVVVFETLDREACVAAWRKQFGHEPPKHVSVRFMRRALAHEAQIKRHGGPSAAIRKALKSALKGDERLGEKTGKRNGKTPSGKTGSLTVPPPTVLRTGTHLVREWNGRTYQVEVLDGGFQLDGKRYRSLSAIARKITGAHWSGPRFFGLG